MSLASALVASLRITDCREFSTIKKSVIFAGHLWTMLFTTRGEIMEYSYRDCLSEEIEILRLMLYRDEFLTLDPKTCKHSGHPIRKIEENTRKLYGLDNKLRPNLCER